MKLADFTKIVRPVALANKSFNKIFCVGYNKTGTTTMEQVLRTYGYAMPQQSEQEIRLTRNVFKTNYAALYEFVQRYDAFQDLPFSQGLTFVAVDALFPDSKFILTVRDPESWYESLSSFHTKNFGPLKEKMSEEEIYEKFTYLYPGYGYENRKRMVSTIRGGGGGGDICGLG